MDKKNEINNAAKMKEKAVNEFSNYIDSLLSSGQADNEKRAKLISQWAYKYIKYISNEKVFNSEYLPRLKRGSIVLADFGYRIGNEVGGLHYAIVVDNKNEKRSGTVTVIPLTSEKENSLKKLRHNQIYLGDAFLKAITDKCSIATTKLNQSVAKLDQCTRELNICTEETNKCTEILNKCIEETSSITRSIKNRDGNIELLISAGKKKVDELVEKKNNLHSKRLQLIKKLEKLRKQEKQTEAKRKGLEKIIKQIQHMKSGSIAHLNQITSISKMRIANPCNPGDSLYGIKVPPEILDSIDKKIKELYLKLPSDT